MLGKFLSNRAISGLSRRAQLREVSTSIQTGAGSASVAVVTAVHIKCGCSRIKHYAVKVYGGVDVEIHIFLTLHKLAVNGQLHAPAALPPGKEPPVPIG
jgi:hypothetical protein